MTTRGTPWATAALALATTAVFFVPAAGDALIFDRRALLGGQVWRLWTGHAVHFTAAHLLWNLAVLLAAGGWLERLAPHPMRWFCAAAAPVIAGVLLVFAPDLARYGGLSGVGAGLMVLLALKQLTNPGESRAIWLGVLALVTLKVTLESWTDAPFLTAGIRSVPLAHVAGIGSAVATFIVTRGKRAEKGQRA